MSPKRRDCVPFDRRCADVLALLVIDADSRCKRTVELHRGDRVVLVDDGNHAEFEERVQRCAQVPVADGIEEVVFGEEHLRDAAAETIERIIVERHQARLANRSAGLHLFERLRTLGQTESRDAKSDSTGADHEDVDAAAAQRCNLLDQPA